MAATRFAWFKVRDRKRALITRDPLGKDLVNALVDLYGEADEGRLLAPRARRLWRLVGKLRRRLEQKYRTTIGILDAQQAYDFGMSGQSPEWIAAKAIGLTRPVGALDDEQPWRTSVNFGLPGTGTRSLDIPLRRRTPVKGWLPQIRDGRPPTFIFLVNVAAITEWDLNALARVFKGTLRSALDALPPAPRRRRTTGRVQPQIRAEGPFVQMEVDLTVATRRDLDRCARRMKDAVRAARAALPAEARVPPSMRQGDGLAFLRTISARRFVTALRRYDWHIRYGLSFRLIALLEADIAAGRPVPASPLPRRVGFSVRGADSVEQSVGLIYEAIHRKPYRARRRRLDLPADVQPFACPDHPGAGRCPDLTCPHLGAWLAQIEATLPSENTGLVVPKRQRPGTTRKKPRLPEY